MGRVLVTVLVGGVGGARFLQGVKEAVGPQDEIRAVVNVGDEVAVSLHAYAPALPVTTRYVLRDGQLAAA